MWKTQTNRNGDVFAGGNIAETDIHHTHKTVKNSPNRHNRITA
ncbi:hypothetical protein [Prevotella aurantiaca]